MLHGWCSCSSRMPDLPTPSWPSGSHNTSFAANSASTASASWSLQAVRWVWLTNWVWIVPLWEPVSYAEEVWSGPIAKVYYFGMVYRQRVFLGYGSRVWVISCPLEMHHRGYESGLWIACGSRVWIGVLLLSCSQVPASWNHIKVKIYIMQ